MNAIEPTKFNGFELITPTETETMQAQKSSRHLAKLLSSQSEYELRLTGAGEALTIPTAAMQLLAQILAEMAQGNAVTFIPIQAELTTQQAASFLNVSRPFLIQKLEKGEIPFHKVGTHRRVRFQDLLQYKQQIDERRLGVLEELSAQAQELNMGY